MGRNSIDDHESSLVYHVVPHRTPLAKTRPLDLTETKLLQTASPHMKKVGDVLVKTIRSSLIKVVDPILVSSFLNENLAVTFSGIKNWTRHSTVAVTIVRIFSTTRSSSWPTFQHLKLYVSNRWYRFYGMQRTKEKCLQSTFALSSVGHPSVVLEYPLSMCAACNDVLRVERGSILSIARNVSHTNDFSFRWRQRS